MIKIENTIKDKVSQINSSNNVNQYLNVKLEQENNKDSKTTITKSKNQDIYKTIRKKASIINSDQRNIQDKISLIQAQEQKISQIENTLKYARKEYEQAIKSEKKEEVKQKIKIRQLSNKIDNLKDEENAWEFYNLGIGDPVAISAGQGKGLGDMLDMVVSHFDSIASTEEEEEDIKIAMIGKPNVGKSSLINRLLGEERLIVSDIAGTTRDAIDSKIESEFGKFTLIDTAGLRRKSKVKEEIERYSVIRTLAAVERADVCILMIDATEGVTEQDEKIIGFAHELNKAIMVIVNKWDLIEKDDKTMDNYKKDLQSKLKFIKYAKFLFISALTGQRAHKVLEVARECYDNYDKRIGTGVLNEVINKAVLMKEPPVVALKRLKIYYATQVATKPPKFVFFVNDSSCRHFSYERYLENQLRYNFDFSGTGIQIEYRERKDS